MSTVPNNRSGSADTPPSCNNHDSFDAEKYGSSTSPVRARIIGSWPAARSASHRSAVRRSCHTIARCRGRPVRAVPHDDGLALVRDADRGDRVARVVQLRRDLGEGLERDAPDVVGVVLDPARVAGSAAGTRGRRASAAGRRRRPRTRARRWCPRRWRSRLLTASSGSACVRRARARTRRCARCRGSPSRIGRCKRRHDAQSMAALRSRAAHLQLVEVARVARAGAAGV